jgi:hypothetical protein
VSIDADHSNMVKFSRFDQVEYVKVRGELKEFAEQATMVVEKRLQYISMSSTVLTSFEV